MRVNMSLYIDSVVWDRFRRKYSRRASSEVECFMLAELYLDGCRDLPGIERVTAKHFRIAREVRARRKKEGELSEQASG